MLNGMFVQNKELHKLKSFEKGSSKKEKNKQTESARRQAIEQGVVQVGTLKGQRSANGTRWGKKQNKVLMEPAEEKNKTRTKIPAPHEFFNSFGRAAKSKLRPIRHWGGEVNSNPYPGT